jgi:hypothetical protein
LPRLAAIRFELQKKKVKPLKSLRRAQNRTPRERAAAMNRRRGSGARGLGETPDANWRMASIAGGGGRHRKRKRSDPEMNGPERRVWIAASPPPVERRASLDALWLLAMTIPPKRLLLFKTRPNPLSSNSFGKILVLKRF